MLSLAAFFHQRPSGKAGRDDDGRARARRLRIVCRMGRSCRRAAQGRLPDGDPGARPDVRVGRPRRRRGRPIPSLAVLVTATGGLLSHAAVVARSDVRGLVYTAAYVPDSAETIKQP